MHHFYCEECGSEIRGDAQVCLSCGHSCESLRLTLLVEQFANLCTKETISDSDTTIIREYSSGDIARGVSRYLRRFPSFNLLPYYFYRLQEFPIEPACIPQLMQFASQADSSSKAEKLGCFLGKAITDWTSDEGRFIAERVLTDLEDSVSISEMLSERDVYWSALDHAYPWDFQRPVLLRALRILLRRLSTDKEFNFTTWGAVYLLLLRWADPRDAIGQKDTWKGRLPFGKDDVEASALLRDFLLLSDVIWSDGLLCYPKSGLDSVMVEICFSDRCELLPKLAIAMPRIKDTSKSRDSKNVMEWRLLQSVKQLSGFYAPPEKSFFVSPTKDFIGWWKKYGGDYRSRLENFLNAQRPAAADFKYVDPRTDGNVTRKGVASEQCSEDMLSGSVGSPFLGAVSPQTSEATDALEMRLERLAALWKKGLISADDYQKKKIEILSEI